MKDRYRLHIVMPVEMHERVKARSKSMGVKRSTYIKDLIKADFAIQDYMRGTNNKDAEES